MVGLNKLSINLFSAATSNQCMTKFVNWNTGIVMKSKDGNTKPPESEAAVLIPLCQVNDTPSLLYTLRSANMRSHGGQISFPGGKVNKDESHIQAALRETSEEIGLSSKKIHVWGKGNAIPGRNLKILITPVVGVIKVFNEKDLNVNNREVAKVFTVPLETLCNPKNQFHTQFKNGMILPVFVADGFRIWGITAYLTHMLLSSLLTSKQYKNFWVNKKVIIDVPADLRNNLQ